MEPESATYFLGKSFSGTIRSASDAHPDRVTFTLRIGHDCAIEMVGMQIERPLFPYDEVDDRKQSQEIAEQPLKVM